jgi:hypothetical protein
MKPSHHLSVWRRAADGAEAGRRPTWPQSPLMIPMIQAALPAKELRPYPFRACSAARAGRRELPGLAPHSKSRSRALRME